MPKEKLVQKYSKNVDSNFIHNSQKVETTQMFNTNNEWINKMWYIHAMEYIQQ